MADIHLGNFLLLFVSLYQVLVKLKFLAFFGLLKIAVFLLPIAIDQVFGPFCGFELFIGFVANLVVIVVRKEAYHRIFVLNECSEDFNTLSPNAFFRHTCENVKHSMKVFQRVQICIDLANEQKLLLANRTSRIRQTLCSDPCRASSNLRWRYEGLCHKRISWGLINEAEHDKRVRKAFHHLIKT